MKRPNNRNGRHHVRFRISRTPIDTVVDMLREDNNGKTVVLHRTHLRNISDQDFMILEELYQELGTLYNRKKRKYGGREPEEQCGVFSMTQMKGKVAFFAEVS